MKVVVSASLSTNYDKRYIVIDETTNEILDDAQGYGYKTAQNAHRAYSYKQLPPKKKRQREAAKRRAARDADDPELAEAYLRAIKDGGDTDSWAASVLHAAGIHQIDLGDGDVVPLLPPPLKVVRNTDFEEDDGR